MKNRSNFFSFTQEFRDELIKFGDVWTNLPKTVCDLNVFAARAQNESCWNGFAIQRLVFASLSRKFDVILK